MAAAAAVQVSAKYRVTAFPPPPGADPDAAKPGPPVVVTVFDGPEPDDPHFRQFINYRWREVQGNLGCGPPGCGHMLVCRIFDPPEAPPLSREAVASGVPDVLRSGLSATDDRQPQAAPPPAELVFACMCDGHTHACVTYWGHPPDKPEIKVVPLDAVRAAKTDAGRPATGLVYRGIPSVVSEAVADATKITSSQTRSEDP